jgi:hypothetical protein
MPTFTLPASQQYSASCMTRSSGMVHCEYININS